MAKEVQINSWCDLCLENDRRTEAETIHIPAMFDRPAFDVEACDRHAAPLTDALEKLAAVGRAPDGKRKAPSKQWANRPDNQPGEFVCPACPDYTAATLATLRVHVRREHDKSLADVGYYPVKEACPECGDGFPNKQGLAAHIRTAHARTKKTA